MQFLAPDPEPTPDSEPQWRIPLIAAGIVIGVSMVLLVIAYVKLAGEADDEAQAGLLVAAPVMLGLARRSGSR
jgi:hypothetical protein